MNGTNSYFTRSRRYSFFSYPLTTLALALHVLARAALEAAMFRFRGLKYSFPGVLLVIVSMTGLLAAQGTKPAPSPNRTKIGVLVPPPLATPTPEERASLLPLATVLQHTTAAHNATQFRQMDMVAEGTVTVHDVNGATVVLAVTVLRSGDRQAHRIFLKGPDGKAWDGHIDRLPPGGARALQMIETQASRGLSQLWASASQPNAVKDGGGKNGVRALTVHEAGVMRRVIGKVMGKRHA